LVVADILKPARCACFQGALDHRVRVITEQFDPGCRRPDLLWAVPTVFRGLTDCVFDFISLL
jgi:hypothetical protein